MNKAIGILLLLASFAAAASDRKTIFVSTSGSDSADGSSPCSAKQTIQPTDNTDILLKRGDTFLLSQTIAITGSTSLGAYGSGPNPAIIANPNTGFAILISPSSHDLSISNLTFDSSTPNNTDESGAASALQIGGKNISVCNCLAKSVDYFINANLQPNGLSVIGCTDAGPTSIRGYFVWVQGTNISILNNTVSNSTRQHCIRVGNATNLSICGNNFANIDRTATDAQDIAKATINTQIVRNCIISGNVCNFGPIGVGPLGGADNVAHPEQKSENVIVSDNVMNQSNINVTSGVNHVLVTGNTVHKSSGVAFFIQPFDPTNGPDGKPAYLTRTLTKVELSNNRYTLDGPDGNFLIVANAAAPSAITMTDNLMVAPQLTTGGNGDAAVLVYAGDLTGFATIAGNHWPVPVKTTWVKDAAMYVWPLWSDPRGYLTPAQWNALPQVQNRDVFSN